MEQALERRTYERRRAVTPVLYTTYGAGRYSDAVLSDVCLGGMAFTADKALSPGSDICIKTEDRLALNYGCKLLRGLRAEVVWCRPLGEAPGGQYRVGVEYYEPALTYHDRPWQRCYAPGVPGTIPYEHILAPGFLTRSARMFPDRKAFVCNGASLAYGELDKAVGRLATCLTAFGIQKGDHVAIVLPNVIQAVIGCFAVLKIGAVAVPCDAAIPDRNLAKLFRDIHVKTLITLDSSYRRMIALRRECGVRQIVFVSEKDYATVGRRIVSRLTARHRRCMGWGKTPENIYMWSRVMSDYSVNPPNTRLVHQDQALCLAGRGDRDSPGCMQRISHGELSLQVQQLAAWFAAEPREPERILGVVPFHGLFGLLWTVFLPVFHGWQSLLSLFPREEDLPELIRRLNPTIVPMASGSYTRLAGHSAWNDLAAATVTAFIAGQTPLALETARACVVKTGAKIIEAYSPGDVFPLTHFQPVKAGVYKVGSIGIPLPDVDCRVVEIGEGKCDVPIGKTGELIYRGPWRAVGGETGGSPKGVAGEMGKPIWQRSGAMVRMDEDGFFYRGSP
ncbi:MAG: AMP-binding protein [Thermodesulfobacteriota bacterium]